MNEKAVFLDRDGCINRDVGYPDSYSKIDIFHYSYEAVRKINQAGLKAVVVTNQSGIGRGLILEKNLEDIHRKMQTAFRKRGAHFDKIYYCPHFPGSDDPAYRVDCRCRKPNPGMALRAAAELGVRTQGSYMVGDKVEDIEFGLNIGARPVLVLTGYGVRSQKECEERSISPAFVASNLLDAVNWILKEEAKDGLNPEKPRFGK